MTLKRYIRQYYMSKKIALTWIEYLVFMKMLKQMKVNTQQYGPKENTWTCRRLYNC